MEVLSVPVQLMDDVTINWISKVKGFGPDTKLHELLKFDPEMEGFEVYAKYFNTPKPIAQSMPAAATMSTQYSSPVAKDVVSESVTPSQSTLDELSRSTAIVKKNIDFLLASQSHDENLKPAVNIDIITKGNESKSALTLTEDDIATLQDTLQDLQGLYFQKHGREPTEDEMSQWIDVLSGPDGKEHIRLQQSLQEMKSAVTTATSAADDIENTDCDKLKGFNALSLDEATK